MKSMNTEKRFSLGLPEKSPIRTAAQQNNENGITNSMTGVKASMNYLKNSAKKPNNNTPEKLIQGTTSNDILNATSLTPIKETFNLETFARIEQLLESSKSFLEEVYTSRRSTDGITPGGAGALGEGKGVEKINHSSQLNAQRSASTRISNEKINNQQTAQSRAAKIEPQITTRGQTIGMTQGSTNKASEGKLLGAQNNQQKQARLEDQWQLEKQQMQQG
jgi:hypothetical protein